MSAKKHFATMKNVSNSEECVINPSQILFASHNQVNTRYFTALNLVPKTLFKEFQNLVYLWFLIFTILELLPPIKNSSLKLSTLLPLILLLMLKIINNAILTFRQYKQDKEINRKEFKVWEVSEFKTKLSENIRVGDFIQLEANQTAPADILILGQENILEPIFLNMKDLFNLKDFIKEKPFEETQLLLQNGGMSPSELRNRIEYVKVNNPGQSFQEFSGKVKMKENPKALKIYKKNFIVGGSKIVNCSKVLGLVLYAGMKSKIWLNFNPQSLFNLSKTEKLANFVMKINFCVMVCFVFISFLIGYFYGNKTINETVENLFLYNIILYCNFVPISLYLTLKISTTAQS